MTNSSVLLQLPRAGDQDAVTLVVRLVTEAERHVEFEETVGSPERRRPGGDPGAESGQLRVPGEDLPLLADELAGIVGIPVADPDRDPWHRLLAALTALVQRGDLGSRTPYGRNLRQLLQWCEEAGVSAVHLASTDGDSTRVVGRIQVLDRAPTTGGQVRTLLLALSPATAPEVSGQFGVRFVEQHDARDEPRQRWNYTFSAGWAKLEQLVGAVERHLGEPVLDSPADLGERLLASTAALVASPGWGPESSPGEVRDRLSGLFEGAGLWPRSGGTDRDWTLLRTSDSAGARSATLRLQFPAVGTPRMLVCEQHGTGDMSSLYMVETPPSAVAALLRLLQTRRPDVAVPAGDPPARLAAYLGALAERGELGSLERHRECQARFAALCDEAEVPYRKLGTARNECLRQLREANRFVTVSVKFDPADSPSGGGISFGEFSSYHTGADGYDSVLMPYAGLRTLVEFFEPRLGMTPPAGSGDDLEDRLLACFTTLVDQGRASLNRVHAWCRKAGVDAKHDSGFWGASD